MQKSEIFLNLDYCFLLFILPNTLQIEDCTLLNTKNKNKKQSIVSCM